MNVRKIKNYKTHTSKEVGIKLFVADVQCCQRIVVVRLLDLLQRL